MEMNYPILLLAALVPLVVGFVWYNPKVFGTIWMNENKFSEADMKGANMAKIFVLTYLCSFFISFIVQFLVIHQLHVFSSVMNEPGVKDPNSPIGIWLADFMSKYGHNFRTFKHGALHGFLSGLFLVLPIIAINGLFERKSGKYIMIHGFYWVVCLMLMGGIICQLA